MSVSFGCQFSRLRCSSIASALAVSIALLLTGGGPSPFCLKAAACIQTAKDHANSTSKLNSLADVDDLSENQSKEQASGQRAALDAQQPIPWPGQQSRWRGFERHDFEVDGRSAYVVSPRGAAPGRPWVWRARFPNFHAAADLILLERGFHVAYLDTAGMLGSPRAMGHWDAFYQFVTERGLAEKVVLEGVSRGGLFVYNFAARWPERVACIYCDTPVCDIASWPGGKGQGKGDPATWQACLEEYGLTENSAAEFADIPLNRLAPIAKLRIPILHIVSLNDRIVPPAENSFPLAERYRKLGGDIDVIEVPEGTAKSNGHHFEHPDPIRVADFIERNAGTLPGADVFAARSNLLKCAEKFRVAKRGRVVFLGGSITTGKGWRNQTMAYLESRFPETSFEFIDAGISSTGSLPAAFRMQRDVFAQGEVDLLFEEAAVNDLHNGRTKVEMIRGMEGLIRQAKVHNPEIGIVLMHFVDPQHMVEYRAGRTPRVIECHEKVAAHYSVSSLNLAKEVTDRIAAGQFKWEKDFVNCHPSPFGHQIYSAAIRRTLSRLWEPASLGQLSDESTQPADIAAKLPQPLDSFSFDRGTLVPPETATQSSGFRFDPRCDVTANGVGGNTRKHYQLQPMLVGDRVGDEFELQFSGRAIGLMVAAGPDAGTIEYSVDDRPWQTQLLFTKWSRGLHIPWAYMLDSELESGAHRLRVRIVADQDSPSKGNCCRIVNFLVNE